jgi:PBP1b-binding outer membrane lipoprotein LpoB
MKKWFLGLLPIMLVVGCTPSLQYSEISPRIDEFKPTSVAILPFTNSIGMEQPNEATNNRFANSIQSHGMFQRIVDPAQVQAFMASHDAATDVITKFRTKWVATGFSDKASTAWIGQALNTDTIIFGEISQWAKTNYGDQYVYRAGLNLRWVDCKTGVVLWKASHVLENHNGVLCIIGCSSVEGTMQNVVDAIVGAWPKPQTKN